MDMIKMEPGREPEIISITPGAAELDDVLGAAPYGVAIDPAGLYIAFVSEMAQFEGTDDGYYSRYANELMYGTVVITRHDHQMAPASVHAEDLGRVAGLLQPVDAYGEVC
ncbi:hypothetical protein [Allofournierella sp.]|uniref:hypothetical protein n=1 Tax=Allofournierella sp. TaxID=1940256 RepID=UPI003AEF36B7